jgi:hypothetical protein
MDCAEKQLRHVAFGCITHAQALYKEACLLAQHEWHPRTVALAVRGTEEVATSVAYTIAALNYHEGVLLPHTIEALLHHDVHHGSTATGAAGEMETREEVDVTASMAGSPGESGSACRNTLLQLTRKGLQGLLPATEDTKASLPALHDRAQASTPSVFKARRLCVDPRHGAMAPPSQVKAREATDAIGTLARFLTTFSLLSDVLADDMQWHQFTETMRHHAGVTDALNLSLAQ